MAIQSTKYALKDALLESMAILDDISYNLIEISVNSNGMWCQSDLIAMLSSEFLKLWRCWALCYHWCQRDFWWNWSLIASLKKYIENMCAMLVWRCI